MTKIASRGSNLKWLIGFSVHSSSDKYMDHWKTQIIQRAASYAKGTLKVTTNWEQSIWHQTRFTVIIAKNNHEKRKEKTATKIVAKNEKLQQTK